MTDKQKRDGSAIVAFVIVAGMLAMLLAVRSCGRPATYDYNDPPPSRFE